jgi:hypothetical protein
MQKKPDLNVTITEIDFPDIPEVDMKLIELAKQITAKIVTNDSPKNHLHHHGIWSAWTSSEFEGRKSNFWESKEKQGRIECIKVEDLRSGPRHGPSHFFTSVGRGVFQGRARIRPTFDLSYSAAAAPATEW